MNFFRILLALILLSLSLSIMADNPVETESTDEIQLPLTKQSAAELVQLKSKGKILSVDEKMYNGNTVFIIKVVNDDGKVKIYSFDAETGRLLH